MRTLIIPCAGKSTRYNTEIPKYLLKHPSGNMMVYESIQGLPLNFFDKIYIIVLRKHMIDNTLNDIKEQFREYDNFNIFILEKETSCSSESVYKCLKTENIKGEIYIKDSDCYFDVKQLRPNQVCIYSLNDADHIIPGNKSYVRRNRNNEILSIIEKDVISSEFCCGLYSFKSSDKFIKTFEELYNNISQDLYISHIIYRMLLDNERFYINNAKNFVDWGTQKDWDMYNQYYKKKDNL
jgi:bifunctional N-acetylglucosamine-1-phosphate-uridyltransferase/glucosamine-1-phosphate-acetyltransferase GlmU-like protein